MTNKESVFKKTYENYLAQVDGTDFNSVKKKLGVEAENNEMIIPLFGKLYKVSKAGISDPGGKQPMLDICVILCKYILLCPQIPPKEKDWVSFRDLKDSGPLTSYFVNDVERAIATHFNGRLGDMKNACRTLKGYSPDIEVSYDLSSFLTMLTMSFPQHALYFLKRGQNIIWIRNAWQWSEGVSLLI